jgi:hypothetical protein
MVPIKGDASTLAIELGAESEEQASEENSA